MRNIMRVLDKSSCAPFVVFMTLVLAWAGFGNNFAEAEQLWKDAKNTSPPIEITLPSFAPVIEKLGAGVVNISIEGEQEQAAGFAPGQHRGEGMKQPPFDRFFPMPPQQQGARRRSFSSLGSGFVVNKDGYIITNNHVVEKATKITVKFRDEKKRYEAKLVGHDAKTDIALLKVDVPKSVKLTPVVLGDSDKLASGDWVIAIGNPFRLGHTATVGIVSAKSRRNVGGPYTDFIQTDASINPGNSGGPLFNARGEVVGINTAIFSRGGMGSAGFNIGIGFAIPINIVKGVITQLRDKGKVTRGWLGVLIQAVTSDAADALGIDDPRGALVADVVVDSPAEKAGLQRRDVIVAYDGQEVEENDDLPQMVGHTVVGRSVPVTVIRDGEEVSLTVHIAELKEEVAAPKKESKGESMLGMSIQDITPDIAKGLDLKAMDGVIVTDVTPDSAADRAGVRRGDVILEVDSKATNSSDDFSLVAKAVPQNKPLLMLIRRGAHTLFFTLKVE